jgi:hypothetical protein
MVSSTANRGEPIFPIAYQKEGERELKMRRQFEDAFALAQQVALELGEGASDVVILSGTERFEHERAVEISSPLGLSLDHMALRFAEASKQAGGPEYVVEAARLFFETKKASPPPKMVADVVAELIENRRANGKSALYLRDMRVRLEQRFAGAFHGPISSVGISLMKPLIAPLALVVPCRAGRPAAGRRLHRPVLYLRNVASHRGPRPLSRPDEEDAQAGRAGGDD